MLGMGPFALQCPPAAFALTNALQFLLPHHQASNILPCYKNTKKIKKTTTPPTLMGSDTALTQFQALKKYI